MEQYPVNISRTWDRGENAGLLGIGEFNWFPRFFSSFSVFQNVGSRRAITIRTISRYLYMRYIDKVHLVYHIHPRRERFFHRYRDAYQTRTISTVSISIFVSLVSSRMSRILFPIYMNFTTNKKSFQSKNQIRLNAFSHERGNQSKGTSKQRDDVFEANVSSCEINEIDHTVVPNIRIRDH